MQEEHCKSRGVFLYIDVITYKCSLWIQKIQERRERRQAGTVDFSHQGMWGALGQLLTRWHLLSAMLSCKTVSQPELVQDRVYACCKGVAAKQWWHICREFEA